MNDTSRQLRRCYSVDVAVLSPGGDGGKLPEPRWSKLPILRVLTPDKLERILWPPPQATAINSLI
jgi:hypothetical protein